MLDELRILSGAVFPEYSISFSTQCHLIIGTKHSTIFNQFHSRWTVAAIQSDFVNAPFACLIRVRPSILSHRRYCFFYHSLPSLCGDTMGSDRHGLYPISLLAAFPGGIAILIPLLR